MLKLEEVREGLSQTVPLKMHPLQCASWGSMVDNKNEFCFIFFKAFETRSQMLVKSV